MSTKSIAQNRSRASHSVAARSLLNGEQVRESLKLSPQPLMRLSLIAGLQAALTTLIALPLVYFSPWPHLIGFASLGTLVALFGRFAPEAQRTTVVLGCAATQVLTVFTMSLLIWLGAPMVLQILALTFGCGLLFYVVAIRRFGLPGPLIFVFAGSAVMGKDMTFTFMAQATATTAAVALLAVAVCWWTERFRIAHAAGVTLPSDSLPSKQSLLIVSSRIVIACTIAAFTAYALGANHPGWAALGTLAVMQAPRLNASMNRSLQRMVGTTVGALLIGLVLAQSPSIWPIIGLLLVLTVATEVIIGFNYGLGQILVTPMALLMTYLADPKGVGNAMIYERIADTLLGATVGIVAAIFFSTIRDRLHLARHHADRLKR